MSTGAPAVSRLTVKLCEEAPASLACCDDVLTISRHSDPVVDNLDPVLSLASFQWEMMRQDIKTPAVDVTSQQEERSRHTPTGKSSSGAAATDRVLP